MFRYFIYTKQFIQNLITMKQWAAILSECDKSCVLLAYKQSRSDYKRKKNCNDVKMQIHTVTRN